MFGISGEHLVILGIVLLIFGPRRLPELGHTLGKAYKNFKDSISGVEQAAYRHLPPEAESNKDPLKTETKKAENQPPTGGDSGTPPQSGAV